MDIEAYGESKYEWLKSFLELPNGIPSHDTFARVFARLDPEKLQQSKKNLKNPFTWSVPGQQQIA